MRAKHITILLILLATLSCKREKLVIVYTNDTHSQIEVCAGKNNGLGGYAQRAAVIDSLRSLYPNMLLMDAGDFSQGTPYFNLYKGRVEVGAYNQMGYEYITFGNHEFDNGLGTLAARLHEAKFKVLCANYNVIGTPLEGLVEQCTIIRRAGWKVGIIGLGVNPESLITPKNFGGIKYLDPIATANHIADSLKTQRHCDVVIVLSHLGSLYEDENTPSDAKLAECSRNINIILGGHTHKIISERHVNANGDSVLILQNGKAGAYLSKIEIEDERN